MALLISTNIRKGECKDKRKRMFSSLAMPSRILFYQNIVKVARRENIKGCFLYMYKRDLLSIIMCLSRITIIIRKFATYVHIE